MSKIILLAATGIASGFVNGLLGTGGGILLIFALNKLLSNQNNKEIYVQTLTVTLALSVVSFFVYMKKGSIDLTESVKYGAAAIPGGLLGAYLLDKLNGKTVKKMFGILLVIAGLNMSGIF